jgi:prepilin-type processing-associated H-X9-DG protein
MYPDNNLFSNRRAFGAFTLIETLVVIAVAALLLGVLLPSLSRAKKSAESVECRSNLHQIFLATQLYCQNNNGELIIAGAITPFESPNVLLSIWHNALLPYVSKAMYRKPQLFLDNTTDIWFCPSDRDPYPLGYKNYPHGKALTSYAPNGYYPLKLFVDDEPPDIRLGPAGGYQLVEIRDPQFCMFMGETSYSAQLYDADAASAAGYNLPREGHYRCTSGFYHNGKMNILYVDGHIEGIKGKEDGQLVWPDGYEQPYRSGQYMYWPDLTLPSASEEPAFWGPGY